MNTTTTDAEKHFATLRARAALAGHGLHKTEGPHGGASYLVSRWGLVRELPSLDAVERWLDQVTGACKP